MFTFQRSNLQVNGNGNAMISDIGIVGKISETAKSIIYLAPEVFEDLRIRTKEADVYSYGIALWEMWYGTQAFTELMPINKVTFREKITEGCRPEIDNMTINIPAIHNVMKRCWVPEVEERHSAKECYEIFRKIIDERVNKMRIKE